MWEDNTSSVHTHKHLSHYCFRTMTRRQVVWPHLEIVLLNYLFTVLSVLVTWVSVCYCRSDQKIRKDIKYAGKTVITGGCLWSEWIYHPTSSHQHKNYHTIICDNKTLLKCFLCVSSWACFCLHLLLWQRNIRKHGGCHVTQ